MIHLALLIAVFFVPVCNLIASNGRVHKVVLSAMFSTLDRGLLLLEVCLWCSSFCSFLYYVPYVILYLSL